MERSNLPMYVTFIGIFVTVLSFLLYVFFPNNIYIAFFVAGLIVMVFGYLVIEKNYRSVNKRFDEAKASLESEGETGMGWILCLDGDYVPLEECGPIESLENL